jgi:hypothetical protein
MARIVGCRTDRRRDHVSKIVGIFTIIGLAVIPLLQSAPAHAQATRTNVSGVGDDANPCSRTAPCKTFAGAISKTIAGGEITVLDVGGFGAVTITKSLSITNDGVGEAGVLVAGTNAIIINAGANDVVHLRGLVIDGSLPAFGSLGGIRILSAKAVHVQNCVIKNFSGGFGISVATSAGTVQVFVNDTVISNNGSGTLGGGVLVRPSGAGSARVHLTRVMVDGNVFGLRVDGTGSTGVSGNGLFVRDSVVSGNSQAGVSILVPVGGQPGSIFVDRSAVVANGTAGLSADGLGAGILVANSTITVNTTGVATANSGSVFSFKTNNLNNNSTDGAFTTSGLGQQ